MNDPHTHGHAHHEPPPHNMMVVGERSTFLSHLPMFMSPHNFQGILEVSFTKDGKSVDEIYFKDRQSHPDVKMYTLQPGPIKPAKVFGFDFEQPTSHSFNGKVFRGHLERGGQVINGLGEVGVTVKRVVYSQKFDLKQLQKSEELEYILFGSGQELFLAHVISAPPDFDQILSIKTDRTFTDEEMSTGARISIVIPNRTNAAPQRLKAKEKTHARGHVTGAHQFLDLQIEPGVEFYFEEGELLSPAIFEETTEERKAGF
jgi:hypothetical protein